MRLGVVMVLGILLGGCLDESSSAELKLDISSAGSMVRGSRSSETTCADEAELHMQVARLVR